jgi:arylsulfatase A-like enzyme
MISELDGHVGRVLQALDKAGLAERTLVVFTSDNGTTHARQGDSKFHVGGADPVFFNSTAGLRGYKGSLYEGGIRVPMIVRLPGRVQAGAVNDMPGYFADWFPTLCDAAGFEKPAGLDGESLWPAITGGRAPARSKPMVWVFPEYGGQVAVRLGDFKIIRQRIATKSPGPWEVYDLSTDHAEVHDLARDRDDLIAQTEAVLRREVADNPVFPLAIPGINDSAAKR